MLSDLIYRLRALFRRGAVEADMNDELRFHFEQEVEKYVKSGLSREEAQRRARLAFGGVEEAKEECREEWGTYLIDTLFRDVRFTIRLLRKTPTITTLVILSIALGIGANTAIFSLVDAVMLRALPVQKPQQLVQVKFRSPASTNLRITYTNPMWEQVRDHQDIFSGVFAWFPDNFDLANGGESQFVQGIYASGTYFTTLGVRPAIGRLFSADDDRRGCGGAAVLGYGFWRQHYGGAESVLGSTLRLNGHPFPVIGVTQPGFFGTDVGGRFDVALPVCAQAVIAGKNSWLDRRSTWWLQIMGRLKPGITDTQATARLNVLAPQILAASVPPNWPPRSQQIFRRYTFVTVPAATGVPELLSDLRSQYDRPLEVLMVVVGLILLIACANIASLMVARSAARRREIAMRVALGASGSRLVRQVLTESLLLSGGGALLGVIFAHWGAALLVRLVSSTQNQIFLDLSTDGRVLAFTIGIAILTAALFGLLPAWQASRTSPTAAMKCGEAQPGETRSQFRSGRWIVAVQVALALVLLVGTGLFVRTFSNLLTLNPGFDRNKVLLVDMNVHNANVPASARISFYNRILARLKVLPGVTSVSQVWFTPFSGMEWNDDIQVSGYQPPSGEEPLVYFNWVTSDYFATLRTPLLAGRVFDSQDTPTSQRVAIVNQTMARRFFPGQNPIGKYFRISDSDEPNASQPMQIVGIVNDSKYESLREATYPFAYVPLSQIAFPSGESDFDVSSFLIRTAASPTSLIPPVRSAIGRINGAASLQFVTLAQQVDDSLAQERLLAMLAGFFGALALLLTAIGLYGVMAYVVTQQTHEIGIRMALGAQRGHVLRMALWQGLVLIIVGGAAGMAAALGLTRLVSSLLYGVRPTDLPTLVVTPLVLAFVALAACYIPARRAAKVDPIVALRHE
jgi:putative ABC transport system permease protein